jgi:sialate O-acetylesterase
MKNLYMSLFLGLLFSLTHAVDADEALRFADVLTDNIVLQRNKPITCWGWTAPGNQVEVLFTRSRDRVEAFAGKAALERPEQKPGGKAANPLIGQVRVGYIEDAPATLEPVTRKVTADASGRWETTLGKHEASFTPTYLAARSGDTRIAIQNLLIGEVWIASGQSNMEWSGTRDKMWENKGLILNGIRYAKVRGASTSTRESFVDDAAVKKGLAFEPWIVCEDGAVDRVSTVAYLYAQYLHRRLKVPVGIINIAQGGSFAREWCSRELLEKMDSPTVDAHLADFAEKQKVEESVNWRGGPTELYNARLYPIRKMTVAGVIYMQGENESLCGALPQYVKTFPGVIQSYREAIESPDLPFGIITLQGYGGYQVAREIHFDTHKKTPNTGYIVAHDIGGNIHPSWKRPLAERAVYWALRDVYSVLDGVKQNRIEGVRYDGKYAMVDFVESQLKGGEWTAPKASSPRTNDQQPVAGFEISGEDRVWYRARIKTGSVGSKRIQLSHPFVPQPVAVRYGWGGFPCGNLGSWEDPIPPFRSDDWPIVADDVVATASTGTLSPAEMNYLKKHERKNRELENGLKLAIVDSYEQLTKRYAHPKGMLLKTVGNMQELMQGFDAKKSEKLAPELQQHALHRIPCRYWRRDRYSPARRAKWGWLIERVIRLADMPQQMEQTLENEKIKSRIAQLQQALADLQTELEALPEPKAMTMDTMLDTVLPMMETEKDRLVAEEGMDPKKFNKELNKNPF